jgi:hypothetical protein
MTEDSAIRIDLHSTEDVHFTHNIRLIRQDSTTDRHIQVWGVRKNEQSLPSIHSSMGACPLELTSPVNPGSLPPLSVAPVPWRENPSVFSGRINPEGSWFTISHDLQQPGFRGSYRPLYSVRLLALKPTNFGLSPVPYLGNVVARVNCSERTLSDHQCHLKTSSSLFSISNSIFVKPFSENISVE